MDENNNHSIMCLSTSILLISIKEKEINMLKHNQQVNTESSISAELLCQCKKFKYWAIEGKETEKCPGCGRKFNTIYDKNILSLKLVEIK